MCLMIMGHGPLQAQQPTTIRLTGTLASTDSHTIKCELEGQTTIESIVEEGTMVKGPTDYRLKAGDTLESIAREHGKSDLSIRQLNEGLGLDWDKLPAGRTIRIPGDLLIELDPMNLKERITKLEIIVARSENTLLRARGNLEEVKLITALDLKQKKIEHRLAMAALKNFKENEMQTVLEDLQGQVDVAKAKIHGAEKILKLDAKDDPAIQVEIINAQAALLDAQRTLKLAEANLKQFQEHHAPQKITRLELASDLAMVDIEKTKKKKVADLGDAASYIITMEKTLVLEKEQLEDLREQMSNTRIYAPKPGTVVYYAPPHWEKREPVDSGASVRRGHNIIKLPKDKALKVDLSIPQAMHKQLGRGMRAWVQVDGGEPIPGTLTLLSDTVDSKRRGHTQQSYFKGEVTLGRTDSLPDFVSVGMSVKVEIQVKNLVGKNRLIKIPNQCITSKIISKNISQRGCFVLNPVTEKPEWRPVTIAYIDEIHSAIKSEVDPGRGLHEGELIHLSPLTQAESLNLEEGVTNKGKVELGDPKLDEDVDKEAAGG